MAISMVVYVLYGPRCFVDEILTMKSREKRREKMLQRFEP